MINSKQYLARFDADRGFFTSLGDSATTTLGSTGAVILAYALGGEASSEYLAQSTGLPPAFIDLVVLGLEHLNLFESDRFADLLETLKRAPDDYRDVEGAMHSVVEELWDRSGPGLPRSYFSLLEDFRAGFIVGGWLEPEALIALGKKQS